MASTNIDTGKAIGYGWATVKKDLWYFVAIALIVMVIGSIGQSREGASGWSLLALLLSAWMASGYWTLFLSYHSGKKLPLGDLFVQTKHILGVLGATLLVGIVVGVGIVLLIIPGIYFALKYQFTVLALLDKNLGVLDAMKYSAQLTNGNKMSLFGFDLVTLGITILGAILFGVGLLVAVPVVWMANVAVYRSLSAQSQAPLPTASASA